MKPVRVSDHAVLRYLERAHGLDVEAVRLHLKGHAVNGARLGAVGVQVGKVKLVLLRTPVMTVVPTVIPKDWPIVTDEGEQ